MFNLYLISSYKAQEFDPISFLPADDAGEFRLRCVLASGSSAKYKCVSGSGRVLEPIKRGVGEEVVGAKVEV